MRQVETVYGRKSLLHKLTPAVVARIAAALTSIFLTVIIALTQQSLVNVTVRLYGEHYPVLGTAVTTELKGKLISTIHFINIPYAWVPGRFGYPTVCNGSVSCGKQQYIYTESLFIQELVTQERRCIHIPVVGHSMSGTESCLFLTVVTPNFTGSLPVLVYLNSMENGSITQGDPHQVTGLLAYQTDSVVVVPNYRAGSLGFLSSKHLESQPFEGVPQNTSGNYGHADQIAAIRWVSDNIRSFGGDPGRVTLIGRTSVLVMLMAPQANNLFHNVIAFNPSFHWESRQSQERSNRTTSFVSEMGCLDKPQLLECLRGKQLKDFHPVIPSHRTGLGFYGLPYYNNPLQEHLSTTSDGAVVMGTISEYQRYFNTSTNRSTINVFFANTLLHNKNVISRDAQLSEVLTRYFSIADLDVRRQLRGNIYSPDDAVRMILNRYLSLDVSELTSPYETSANTMTRIISDLRVNCPTVWLAEILNESPHLNVRILKTYNHTTLRYRIKAGEEIAAAFGVPGSRPILGQQLRQIIRSILHDTVSPKWTEKVYAEVYGTEEVKFVIEAPQFNACETWKDMGFFIEHGFGA